jgi:formyl-CoA transferase
MSEELLLEGLKVVEVSSWIAAPSCGAMLADRGAQVIKVEPPEVGDAYRGYYELPPSPNSEVNFTWILDNRNKRSMTLNLKSDQGKAILHRMVADCDIYITNQPLPFRREQGLTWEDLQPLNERMIYASITAYGEEGPERDREGFDLVGYWSRSGLMNQMRHKGVEPFQAMAGMGDHPTAVALYGSIMTALFRRERTGKGSKVHTSLLANGLWSASCFAQAAWADADFSQIPGQRLTTALYLSADNRWLQFSMVRQVEDFDRLVLALGHPEWLIDERFATPEQRLEHHDVFTQMMRDVIIERTAAQWMEIFAAENIPAALVAEFQDLPGDPQVLANELAMVPVEEVGMARVIRDPINVDGLGRVGAKPAPDMGEHTDQVLRELGFSQAEIAAWREAGIV